MPPKERFTHIRLIALSFIVLFSAFVGTYAVTVNSAPNSILAVISEMIPTAVRPTSDGKEKSEEPGTDKLGVNASSLIYGMGDLPLHYSDRRDKIWLQDPVNGPSALSSVNDFEPAWSPDGSKIAFISLRDGLTISFENRRANRDLYIMNADGTDQRRLGGYLFGGESQPSFSPDGRYIVYSADYSSGGGSYAGIYIYDTQTDTHSPLVTDVYEACYSSGEKRNRHSRKSKNDLAPGNFGFDTPVFSPDGQYILFGDDLDYGKGLRRIKIDGTECTEIYQQNNHYDPLFAQYSPDGTKIALTYGYQIYKDGSKNDGIFPTNFIVITDVNGNIQQEIPISKKARYLSWSPNGNEVAYIASTSSPEVPNGEIWSVNINDHSEQQVIFQGGYETFRGLSWGTPSSYTPNLRLKINDPHPVYANSSTTGTVYLNAPAPAGGTQITLSYNGDLSSPQIFILPVTSITVPEGESEATFNIEVPDRDVYRSADVVATRSAPYGYARATVTVIPQKADLAITTFTAPPAVAPGSNFTINSVISNIGGASTANGFTDRVFFSLDETLDGLDGLPISTRSHSALAAGSQTTLNEMGANIPSDRVPGNGTYYLIYETNASRTVDENLRYSNNRLAIPIQIALPDIVSENITVPAEILPGTNYPVSWEVKNIGSVGTENSFINKLFISFDETIGNEDDVELASRVVNSLAAGSTASHSHTINIPTLPVHASGPATIYAVADINDNVYEGPPTGEGELNNRSTAGTQFNYKVADIQVTGSSSPAEIDSDTPFALEWTTANTGNRDAGAFSEQVYFSVDNTVNANDFLLNTFPLPSGLASEDNVTRIQNVTIPTGRVPASGNYWIYIRTDSNNSIDEGAGETNNIRWHQVNVRRLLRPDIVVSNITAPANANFDQTIQVQWTVTNNGQGPTNVSGWRDSIYLNTTGSATSGRIVEVDNVGHLNPGESYVASAAIKIPRGYVGAYKIVVKTDERGALNEENTSNNTLTRNIQIGVPPLPDLIVNNVQAPAEAFSGGPISIKWTVENIGDANAAVSSNTWRDRVYLSTDQTFSPGTDRLIFTSQPRHQSLPVNGTYTGETRERLNISITGQQSLNDDIWQQASLPPNIPSGQYYVFVITDSHNGVYEYNSENNNVGYDNEGIGFPMTVISTPFDLVGSSAPVAPNNVTGGESVAVSFAIKNQGAFQTAGHWTDGLYLSSDQTWDSEDTLLGSVRNENFGPGHEETSNLYVVIPPCLNGTYYLISKADHTEKVSEFDPKFDAEANNASPAKQINITSFPADLVVTSVSTSPITNAGQQIDVTWNVSNNGVGSANGLWTDRVMLHSNNGMGVLQLASVQQQGPVSAGGSYTKTQTVYLPQFMQGEYFITVETDRGKDVAECGAAEENNIGTSATFSLDSNLPDLVIDSVSTPVTTIQAGNTIPIEWIVRNQGASMPATIAGWSDHVYLSSDTTISNDDKLLTGAITQSPLGAGSSYVKQVTALVGNVPAGTYYLLAITDISNAVFEGPKNTEFETNNLTVSVPITVTSPGIDLQAVVNSVAAPTYSGQVVNIDWTVTNHGDTETLTDSWIDRIILSRDSVIDSSDPVIGWRNRTGKLAGGASYTVNHALILPPGLTGTYRIFVHTDRNNNVVENNDNNNISPAFSVELELPPPADLNVTNISIPSSASPGDSAAISWTYQNSGSFPATGPWRDSVYLSRDQFWDAGDILLGQQARNGEPLGVGSTGTSGRSFVLPPMEEGEYYVIVRLDSQNRVRETNEANNISFSTGRINVGLQTLTMGVEHNTTLNNSGFKSFKFEPGTDETVLVTLNGQPGKNNGLFSKYLTPVNLSNYEYRDDGQNSSDKENLIPVTEEGPYYSIVTNDYVPQNLREAFELKPSENDKSKNDGIPVETQNITVKAEILPFTIRSVSPQKAGTAGKAMLVFEGAKFQQGATAELVGASGNIITPFKTTVGNTKIAAMFDFKDKPVGLYDIKITNPDNEVVTLDDGFEVVQGGGYDIRQEIVGPGSLRFGAARVRYTFSASNDGLNDAYMVPMFIHIPNGYNYTLDTSNIVSMDSILPDIVRQNPQPIHFDHEYGRMIFLMLPVLRSRETINIGVNVSPIGYTNFAVNLMVLPPLEELFASSNLVESPETTQSLMSLTGIGGGGSGRPAPPSGDDCRAKTQGEINRCYANFYRSLFFYLLGFIPGGDQECLMAAIGFLGGVGDLATSVVMNNVVGGESMSGSQIASVGISLLGAVLDKALTCAGKSIPAIGWAFKIAGGLQLLIDLYECLNKEKCLEITRPASSDPNEMIGPAGYGPERFIPARKPLHYRINFENMSDASAPAQLIYITDVLPPELDPRTVRLKEIGFKHQQFTVPENRAFYSLRTDFDAGNDNAIKADISAGLDIVNRRITWTLTAIDPNTGERPLDPMVGLLPPNNEDRDGEGYVTFTVEAYDTFPNRTPISNFATIIFDENEPIVTNTETNLLDSIVPTSQIAPLSATSETPSFPISWSGTDDADGSGFAHCEINVSENGGTYKTAFRTDAISGTELFTGRWGTLYRFYSVCSDNAGNTESASITPDAEIKVLGGAYESDVSPRPSGSDGVVNGDDVDQIRRFIAKLDAAFTYNEIQRIDAAPFSSGGDGRLSVADVIQARRFVTGADPLTFSIGPNDLLAGFNSAQKVENELGSSRTISASRIVRVANKLYLAIEMVSQGDEVGAGFTLHFDPSVLSNPSNIAAGNGAANSVITVNDTDVSTGKLGLMLDKLPSQPIDAGTRQLITMEFDITPPGPASTTISFSDDIVAREVVNGSANVVATTFQSSEISLLSPTSAGIEVTGRVLTSQGRAVPNASVSTVAPDGSVIKVQSSSLGYYRITGLVAGRYYILTARKKGLDFNPRGLDMNNNISGFDLIAQP